MAKQKRKSKKEESKPNFVLTLKLDTEKYQEDILDKRLDIGRRIYNACLNELGKRYRLMVESKEYQKAIKIPKDDESRNLALQDLNKKYRLSEYSLHDFVKPMQHHFKKDLDSLTVQKIATRCFEAFKGKIYHTAKKIHFKKYGEWHSLEGKNNDSGLKFRDNTLVVWNSQSIKVLINPKDEYAQMSLLRKIKYCRIRIDEDKIQRDLYSSFLIMNINPDLSSINRKWCIEKYQKFKTLHDIEIARLKTSTNRKIASMGI